ncbi:hypothetical protein ED733_001019 [Metarhizium rileyi]|uniref:Uncharacterized protein n=1 Tax=Metarhizium rileyi (strain RCEF 4871) TaxID=1649241 RepID=A0A5C6G296_METRR|nr:hypothetical protein ED733_001019 [Metarhizium rileyi]
MAPIDLKDHGDARLETGLLKTQEEENTLFTTPGFDQLRTGSAHHRLEPQESRKMFPFKRLVMVVMLGVLVGFGLALAKDSSFLPSCLGWSSSNRNIHIRAARSFLAKRADASVTNITTPGVSTETSQTSTSQEQTTTPTTSATSTSPSFEPTTTPSLTTSHSSIPSSTTALETSSSSPSTTPKASPTTSTDPGSTPSDTSTSTTSQGQSASSGSSSSSPAKISSKIEKTITTGRVATTSPVQHTMTTTLPDGGTLTITSTSWVAIVPTDKTSSTSGPQLQNGAPRSQGCFTLVLAAGALAVGMLLA